MSLLHLHFGAANYTTNRLQKLSRQLRKVEPDLREVHSQFVHILQLERALTASEIEIVDGLLSYGTKHSGVRAVDAECLVVPRLGTISPWSSKATDVFHLCGLSSVVRVERATLWTLKPWREEFTPLLHDRMTESVIQLDEVDAIFQEPDPKPLVHVALGSEPQITLEKVNDELGLALNDAEITFLADVYEQLGRDPTDVELVMFAQANSEHCRHKIFNADWTIDGKSRPESLFAKIRKTSEATNQRGLISAYEDNAAVIEGVVESRFGVMGRDGIYGDVEAPVDILMKVETHNHPTAISPLPGAATGSGGEIRDEGAVGRGSKPKAGLVGFSTSHLRIPDLAQPWEKPLSMPDRLASALEIMLEGPIGAARFNNEFGRPALTGYFRTFEARDDSTVNHAWGYHKPIMVAGGMGSVFREHVDATMPDVRTRLIVLGGPAMLIGLGGGAASSVGSGTSREDLDFASVQRDNAELQRRCQEVIDRCTAMGDDNPITFIHDVGAGGLSNALPELINDLKRGGIIDLAQVPNLDIGMSPMELWCNEAQERYVLAIPEDRIDDFDAICRRERCTYADVGNLTDDNRLLVTDTEQASRPVDLDLNVLFGQPPQLSRTFSSVSRKAGKVTVSDIELADAIERVLAYPTVASKNFLITIGDRSISGYVVRDQLVGPYQVPVADAAITAASFEGYEGECMAMGERSPLAVVNPAASARMAIAEALTNLASVRSKGLEHVVLSANWMAAAGRGAEDQALHEAVSAASELCVELGIAIPVGKDSLSMSTQWTENGEAHSVQAPVTLIASAFAPVPDVRVALTPQLQSVQSSLVLVELSESTRLGASVVAQVFGQLGDAVPDIEDAEKLSSLFELAMYVQDQCLALSMHDRSDGGLFATLVEMSFAGQIGLDIRIDENPVEQLFNEELGLVFEVLPQQLKVIKRFCSERELVCRTVGTTVPNTDIVIRGDHVMYRESVTSLQALWSSTSHAMQRLRDDTSCADEEFSVLGSPRMRLRERLTFEPDETMESAVLSSGNKPTVAILRDQGVNGHTEMAAAFHRAGFEAVDVHMTDLFEGRTSLDEFQVLAACGGFSYGDVLGAGGGWAKSILYHDRLRAEFERFFSRDTLTLGVCNGCQMLSQLKTLIPAADDWPTFEVNRSEQFEARVVQVRIENADTPWLIDMYGSFIPVPVAHGEGNATFATSTSLDEMSRANQIAMRYVEGDGKDAKLYPMNPNGSEDSVAGVLAAEGRVLALMPHPERVFRSVQNSWLDPIESEREDGPWMRLFRNARAYV